MRLAIAFFIFEKIKKNLQLVASTNLRNEFTTSFLHNWRDLYRYLIIVDRNSFHGVFYRVKLER